MLKRHTLFLIAISWAISFYKGNTQDIHYSQFFMHLPGQSPANTGAYHGEHRLTANYRSQWQTVPVPYLTMSLFYDSKFKIRSKQDFIGVGIGLDYDKAGDSKLSLTALNASFSYGYNLNKHHQFRIGISPSVGQRRLSEELLKWDNQWDGEKYNQALSPKESFENSGAFFFDLGAGFSYQLSKSKRTYLAIGGSANHLLEPEQTFYTQQQNKVGLPMRFVYHANLSIGLVSFADLLAFGQYQEQDVYEETTASGLLRFYIDKNPGIRLNLLLGAGIRLDDAFYPMAGFQYKNWTALASYDVNTSDFKTATNNRGGLEISVQYQFKDVEPVGLYKKCPLY
ncbi:MAG: PorP/SprF family type IX secretion system membrane protein [Saprospiraceae bacterium]|nr:PorP/SprF family type IX secretion system membrane protein [Saprospiraceae bacterium]